ncbi:hypothetical protein [Yoonia vestfoldensis]|nr:hypothetical protein [Yoonia vestfoldensis]
MNTTLDRLWTQARRLAGDGHPMQRTLSFEITTEHVVFNTLASADLVIWISICLKALVYATTDGSGKRFDPAYATQPA